MNKSKIILVSMLALIGTSTFAQSTAKGTFESSAKIESFCQINSQDINFGVVNLPLTAQSANAPMNVLCSNNTPYKVELSYGGKYGAGTEQNNYTTSSIGFSAYRTTWIIYNNGIQIGTLPCQTGGFPIFESANQSVKDLYRYGTPNQVKNICSGVSLNQSTLTSLNGIVSYDYGIMNGSFKKDSLAYAITIPNDSTKIWNKGVNDYSNIGNGVEQSISLNAKIVPEKSSSKYIAEDSYLDTVTATVIY